MKAEMKVLSGVVRVESSFFDKPLIRNWYDLASLLAIALYIEGVIGNSLDASVSPDQSTLGTPPVQGTTSVSLTCSTSPIFGVGGWKVEAVVPLETGAGGGVPLEPEPEEAAEPEEDIVAEEYHSELEGLNTEDGSNTQKEDANEVMEVKGKSWEEKEMMVLDKWG